MPISQTETLLLLLIGAAAGVFGTWCMDQAGAKLRKRGWIAGIPPGHVGKWFGWMAKGRVFHQDIALSPAVAISVPALYGIHYAIGLGLGALYAALRICYSPLALRLPYELGAATAYGVGTSVLAWFLMFLRWAMEPSARKDQRSTSSSARAWPTTAFTA